MSLKTGADMEICINSLLNNNVMEEQVSNGDSS